ncbi:MAG: type II secretion system protein [Clostridia bacterium]|nr:type II secretion system protein [Clostridia bacterium]
MRKMRRLKGKKGFTLMEVVIALAVVGMITALILPLVSGAIRSFALAKSLRTTATSAEKANATGSSSNTLEDIYVTVRLSTSGGTETAESRYKFTRSSASDGKYDVQVTYYELKKGDESK